MTETYDNASYSTKCRSCGTDNNFTQDREVIERKYLDLGDGFVDVDSEDMDSYGEWSFQCLACGNLSSDLEDLLEEIPEEIEEDFPNYF